MLWFSELFRKTEDVFFSCTENFSQNPEITILLIQKNSSFFFNAFSQCIMPPYFIFLCLKQVLQQKYTHHCISNVLHQYCIIQCYIVGIVWSAKQIFFTLIKYKYLSILLHFYWCRILKTGIFLEMDTTLVYWYSHLSKGLLPLLAARFMFIFNVKTYKWHSPFHLQVYFLKCWTVPLIVHTATIPA